MKTALQLCARNPVARGFGLALVAGMVSSCGFEFDFPKLSSTQNSNAMSVPAERAPAAGEAPAVVAQAANSVQPANSKAWSLAESKNVRLYYQFIDARGNVRFVERIDEVPEAKRAGMGFVELDVPPPLTPQMAQAARRRRSGPSRLAYADIQAPVSTPKVLLYFADWCRYCHKAKAHLDQRGVDYELRDVDIASVGEELQRKTGKQTIPVIDIDGRIMVGFRAARLDQMLEEANIL